MLTCCLGYNMVGVWVISISMYMQVKAYYEKYAEKLIKLLPMDDALFIAKLSDHKLLTGNISNQLKALPTQLAKASYFLDHVIKPALVTGDTSSFDNLVSVMRHCGYDHVEKLAYKIEFEIDKASDIESVEIDIASETESKIGDIEASYTEPQTEIDKASDMELTEDSDVKPAEIDKVSNIEQAEVDKTSDTKPTEIDTTSNIEPAKIDKVGDTELAEIDIASNIEHIKIEAPVDEFKAFSGKTILCLLIIAVINKLIAYVKTRHRTHVYTV